MRNIYNEKKGRKPIAGLVKFSAILIMIMVWILIDKGNIYGQSASSESKASVKAGKLSTGNDLLKANGGDGDDLTGEGSEEGGDNSLVVYPNPVEGDLVFDFEFTVKTGAPFEVMDAQGKLVENGQIKPGVSQQRVDLSRLKSGVYIIRVDAGAKPIIKRIIKK